MPKEIIDHFGVLHANFSGAVVAFATSDASRSQDMLVKIADSEDEPRVLVSLRNQLGRHSVICLYRVWGKPIDKDKIKQQNQDANNRYTLRKLTEALYRSPDRPVGTCRLHCHVLHAYMNDPMIAAIRNMRDVSLAHSDGVDSQIEWKQLKDFLWRSAHFIDEVADLIGVPQEQARFASQLEGLLEVWVDKWVKLLTRTDP